MVEPGGQNENYQKDEEEETIPFDIEEEVSKSPIDIGGTGAGAEEADSGIIHEDSRKPKAKAEQSKKPGSVEGRITGVKNFYAKLHGGAIEYLEQQIADWLADNPDVEIKRTNTVVGEVQAKKTEPNIIITVWY